jgi:hypothetical protein
MHASGPYEANTSNSLLHIYMPLVFSILETKRDDSLARER